MVVVVLVAGRSYAAVFVLYVWYVVNSTRVNLSTVHLLRYGVIRMDE